MNRKRLDPFEEGHLRTIYNGFFHKILCRYCPDEIPHKKFLEDLFDIDNRILKNWRVKRQFSMPGLLCASANVKIQGIGYRSVSQGISVISREDLRNPDEIQVDFNIGQGKKEHVYSLNESEWGWVKLHLEDPKVCK